MERVMDEMEYSQHMARLTNVQHSPVRGKAAFSHRPSISMPAPQMPPNAFPNKEDLIRTLFGEQALASAIPINNGAPGGYAPQYPGTAPVQQYPAQFPQQQFPQFPQNGAYPSQFPDPAMMQYSQAYPQAPQPSFPQASQYPASQYPQQYPTAQYPAPAQYPTMPTSYPSEYPTMPTSYPTYPSSVPSQYPTGYPSYPQSYPANGYPSAYPPSGNPPQGYPPQNMFPTMMVHHAPGGVADTLAQSRNPVAQSDADEIRRLQQQRGHY